MKNIIKFLALAAMVSFCTNSYADNESVEKKITGKWYNPYSYQSNGQKLGFKYKKNGKCKALGVADLKLQSWEIRKDGKLHVYGYQRDGECAPWDVYESFEEIDVLNEESLRLVTTRKPFELAFFYMRCKAMKAKYTPQKKN